MNLLNPSIDTMPEPTNGVILEQVGKRRNNKENTHQNKTIYR
jgi:hypothetical protein